MSNWRFAMECSVIVPSRLRRSPTFESVIRAIVLQNSFLGWVQNFPEALVRSLENDVRGESHD